MKALHDAPPPYGTVVFDCDSTLSAIEGIEELVGDHPEIARLTAAAMDGLVPLEEVYGRRLAIARPTRAQVERIGRRYVERALPHARELFAALGSLGKRLAIVSGGLLPAVQVLGRWLGLADEDVLAVDLRHDASGAYAGFDEASPLARAGGKREVVERLAARPGSGSVVLVGDGATDLEAAPAVARFVAYGGVARREAVFAAARVTCASPDLAQLLPCLTSAEERAVLRRDAIHAALLAAAGEAGAPGGVLPPEPEHESPRR